MRWFFSDRYGVEATGFTMTAQVKADSSYADRSGIVLNIGPFSEPGTIEAGLLAHEYFHMLQYRAGGPTGPIWFVEGAAVYADFEYQRDSRMITAEDWHFSFDPYKEIAVERVCPTWTRGRPLNYGEGLRATASNPTTGYSYALGFLAVQYLTESAPAASLTKWPASFEDAFGMTLAQFYPRYDGWLQSQEHEFPRLIAASATDRWRGSSTYGRPPVTCYWVNAEE